MDNIRIVSSRCTDKPDRHTLIMDKKDRIKRQEIEWNLWQNRVFKEN